MTLRVYHVTRSFPDNERFGLIAQLRRSAASIAANLVEGCSRSSHAVFANFVENACGSAAEVEYHLLLARDVGYLDAAEYESLSAQVDEIRRMLAGLRRTLREYGDTTPRRSCRRASPLTANG